MDIVEDFHNTSLVDALKSWEKADNVPHIPEKEEKSLTRAFEDAYLQGADHKVLAGILNEWKAEHNQLNQMQMTVFNPYQDLNQPDLMQQYVHGARDNLGKGMKTLGEKVKEYTAKVKAGLMKGGEFLTQKIKQAHQAIMSLYHTKGAKLAQGFKKAVDNLKTNFKEKQDFALLNKWEKAVEKAEEAKIKSSVNKDEYISKIANKIKDQTQSKLDKNEANFQKKVDFIETPSLKSRLKVGAKTISDAVLGKEYKEYSANKTTAQAAEELKKAKDKLEKTDAKSIFIGQVKLGVVKAWADLNVAFNSYKAVQFQKAAEKTRAEIEKSTTPGVREFAGRVDDARASGMSNKEAFDKAREGNQSDKKETKSHDLDMDR